VSEARKAERHGVAHMLPKLAHEITTYLCAPC